MNSKQKPQPLSDTMLDTSGGIFEAWPCKWVPPKPSGDSLLEVSGITPDQDTIIGGVKRRP